MADKNNKLINNDQPSTTKVKLNFGKLTTFFKHDGQNDIRLVLQQREIYKKSPPHTLTKIGQYCQMLLIKFFYL